MSLGSQIAWDDTVLPFQLDRSDIRGRVARLDGVLDEVLAQHDYPPAIEALVAEATLLTALIGQTIKLRWKLSLQVRGNGPARLVATDYYGPTEAGEPARVRAYASYDQDEINPKGDPFPQIGDGYLAILIDQEREWFHIRALRRSPADRSRVAPKPTLPNPSNCRPGSPCPSENP